MSFRSTNSDPLSACSGAPSRVPATSRSRTRGWAFALLSVTWFASAHAFAQDAPQVGDDLAAGETTAPPPSEAPSEGDPQRAEYVRLVDEALREFGAGHYREAADVFRAAYALRPSARVLRGLGKAYFELGRYVEASTTFERALIGELDPLEGALRAEVEDLLVRSNRHIGTLEISVRPVDAELVVDGSSVRAGTLRLDEGVRVIQASAPGHEPVERSVRIEAGERVRVELDLEERISATVVEERRPLVVVGSILSAVGVAVLVPASLWLADRVRAISRCDAPSAGVVCANRGSLLGERHAATATLAVGGAALVAGVASLIVGLGEGDEPDAPSARWSCVPSRGGAACVLEGAF